MQAKATTCGGNCSATNVLWLAMGGRFRFFGGGEGMENVIPTCR